MIKKIAIAASVLCIAAILSGCSLFTSKLPEQSTESDESKDPVTSESVSENESSVSEISEVSEVSDTSTEESAPESAAIEYDENDMFAIAYIGYGTIEECEDNLQKYLTKYNIPRDIPVVTSTSGEWYLYIPRYEGMTVSVYKKDFDTWNSESVLTDAERIYNLENTGAFLVNCNASDIFNEAIVYFEYDGKTAESSPFVPLSGESASHGGEYGKDITE